MAAEADEHLQRSIEAGARGGFSAMVVNLRAAREQLGRVRSALGAVRSDVDSATATVASAPKEIDAGQLITLLAPSPAGSRPPAHVEEIGRALPRRAGPRSATIGEFNGEWISSQEDPATVADIRPFRGGGWPAVLIGHVESHVAARMRRQGLSSGEVVLNNITCGNRGFDRDFPETCERYLPSLLPQTYVGTGERIRR